jgi:hypothetical protein
LVKYDPQKHTFGFSPLGGISSVKAPVLQTFSDFVDRLRLDRFRRTDLQHKVSKSQRQKHTLEIVIDGYPPSGHGVFVVKKFHTMAKLAAL